MVEVLSPEIAPNVPRPLEATVRIGNEYAHVLTTPEALRSNLIAEAIQQGIPEDVARSQAARTKFMFGTSGEYSAQLAEAQKSQMKALTAKIQSLVLKD